MSALQLSTGLEEESKPNRQSRTLDACRTVDSLSVLERDWADETSNASDQVDTVSDIFSDEELAQFLAEFKVTDTESDDLKDEAVELVHISAEDYFTDIVSAPMDVEPEPAFPDKTTVMLRNIPC